METQVVETTYKCPFCKRDCPILEAHHLIPQSLGGRVTIDICRDCHKACHALFTNRELAKTYHTKTALFSHADFRKMVAYIAKQDPGGKVRFLRRKRR